MCFDHSKDCVLTKFFFFLFVSEIVKKIFLDQKKKKKSSSRSLPWHYAKQKEIFLKLHQNLLFFVISSHLIAA